MMEAVRTSETSVNIHKTARHNVPEDNHFHTYRHDNRKSQHEQASSDWRTEVLRKFVMLHTSYENPHNLISSLEGMRNA
jgi:phosphomannomutase